MYDGKHPNDWSRGRRNEYGRDRDEPGRDRFLRRTDPFYQPHHSPKRRKLEAGEVEVVSDFNRRPSYPPSFELPPGRPLPPRPFHPAREVPDLDRTRYPLEEQHWPRDAARRDFTRRAEPLGSIPPETKLDDLVDRGDMFGRERRLWGLQEDRFVGRKRGREPSPPRFSQRDVDTRLPYPTSHSNGRFIPTPVSPGHPLFQDFALGSSMESHRADPNEVSPPQSPRQAPDDSDSDKDSPVMSKGDIISRMDTLDSEISQVEEEIQRLRRIQALDKTANRSDMSLADQILACNQEIASENSRILMSFQRTAPAGKRRAGHIFVPDNEALHRLRRPGMIQFMRLTLHNTKTKTKSLVEEYEEKQWTWERTLRTGGVIPPESVASLNNALPTEASEETASIQSARVSRNRTSRSGAARSEADFNQIMQQLNDTARYDPNLRYLKTSAIVPDQIIDHQRTFIDSNRYVEDCETEYRAFLLTNPWTPNERAIFLKRYLVYPKQFSKIALSLPNKSTEEVIRYYYKNKHRLNLKELLDDTLNKRRPQRIRSTPRKPTPAVQPPSSVPKELADLHTDTTSAFWALSQDRPGERVTRSQVQVPVPDPKKVTPAPPKGPVVVGKPAVQKTKVVARAKSPPKKPAAPSTKRALTIMTAGVDQLCFSANLPAPWAELEIAQFRAALSVSGTDFKAIAESIGTKNHWQCRSFYYNFLTSMDFEALLPEGSSVAAAAPTKRGKSNPKPLSTKPALEQSTTIFQEHPTFTPRTLHLPQLEPLVINRSHHANGNSFPSLIVNIPTAPEAGLVAQNWIVEPTKTSTAHNGSLLRSSSGSVPSSLRSDGETPRGFAPFRTTSFDPSTARAFSIRHSFDFISSPLESETKSSVSWSISDSLTQSQNLRHSSSGVGHAAAFAPFNKPLRPLQLPTPSILVGQEGELPAAPSPIRSALSSAETLDSSPISTPLPHPPSPMTIVESEGSTQTLTNAMEVDSIVIPNPAEEAPTGTESPKEAEALPVP